MRGKSDDDDDEQFFWFAVFERGTSRLSNRVGALESGCRDEGKGQPSLGNGGARLRANAADSLSATASRFEQLVSREATRKGRMQFLMQEQRERERERDDLTAQRRRRGSGGSEACC